MKKNKKRNLTRILTGILTGILLFVWLPVDSIAEAAPTSVQATQAVYWNPDSGDDEKDGLTDENAVLTLDKANETANAVGTSDIYLMGEYKVSGSEVWNLGGKTIHRCDIGGYMIELEDENSSLTLNDVVIDGAEVDENADHDKHTESIIFAANGGTIILNSGTVLQNNHAEQWGSAIFASNGANVTMENGAEIRNNTNYNYECGTILVGNGSTFTMNGGTISGNTANSGGGVAIIGSSMVMNGGTISDNSVYRTKGQGSYGGAVYVADYAGASGLGGQENIFRAADASFLMNGGIINNNIALDYGGALTTFPQKGKNVTVTINNGEISGNKTTDGSGGAIAAFFKQTKLQINGGQIKKNTASQYGGGILLNTVSDAQISDGEILENEAAYGGGIGLVSSSAIQTGGIIKTNIASWGGGVYGGSYTMTGGTITDNNSTLTEQQRENTRGDGICVGTALNLGNDAVINTNNDVYLRKGQSIPKEGRFINVISTYTGASAGNPIEISSQDVTVESNGVIGTQLVFYTEDAGGVTAAQQADADGIFVPSWKMSDELIIGQSSQNDKTAWLTYVPTIKIEYEWVSTDNPTDVSKPENSFLRSGMAFQAQEQTKTDQLYCFDGWYTDEQCTQQYKNGTVLSEDTILYGKWTPAVKILPMDLTVYVGGDGYSGTIGANGKFSANDLPEMGFYLLLNDSINALLGSTADNPIDLSEKISLTYNDDARNTTRDWHLKLYGDEDMSHIMMNGRQVYIYKLMPSKIDDTEETIPLRMQFTDADGNVMVDSKFPINENNQFRDYKVDFYPGTLDTQKYRATIRLNDNTTSYPIILGTGSLRVRQNMDENYCEIQNGTNLKVNKQNKNAFLAATAQSDTQYYLNRSGISVNPEHVRLLVDHTLDDALLKAYIEQTSNIEGKYSYQFRYLDLVDISNGNAYVTMDDGQKMDIYWPVPNDAKKDSEFHIVHFKGLDRDSDVNMDDLWTTHVPEEMSGEKRTVEGREFVKFTVDSFSPFALLYEKDTEVTTPAGGDGGIVKKESQVIYSDSSRKNDLNKVPVTGDRQLFWMYIGLMTISGVVMSTLFLNAKRRRHDRSRNDIEISEWCDNREIE